MKKTALALFCVVVAAGAVYYNHTSTSDDPIIQVASQQDTRVDTESSRDTFEYFLSGLGEADINTLKDNFYTYNSEQANAYQIDKGLFQRFINYRAALQDLEPATIEKLDLEAMQQLSAQLITLQFHFFTPQEQQQLFAEENQLRNLALKQLELKQQTISNEDFLNSWQQEIDKLSPVLQQSYRNASLLSQLQRTKSMDEQDRYLEQQALVGTEAANRLETLSRERADFQQTMEQYFEQRMVIQSNTSLSSDEQDYAINELRNTTFSSNQLRRVKALEAIQSTQVTSSEDG